MDASFQPILAAEVRSIRWTMGFVLWITCNLAAAAEVEIAGQSFITTPLTVTVGDQSTLEVVGQCVAAAEKTSGVRWSVWFDRHLDRRQTIDLSNAGPTAAGVLADLSERSGWAIFPAGNVLLVGRQEWVDALLGQIAPLNPTVGDTAKRLDLISVEWPEGTTAAEVLHKIVLHPRSGDESSEKRDRSVSWLPHDVWAAGSLSRVDRRVAVALVLGQFGRRLETTATLSVADLLAKEAPDWIVPWIDPESPPASISVAYPSGKTAASIRQRVAKADRRSRVRVDRDRLIVVATAEAQRRAMAAHWSESVASSSLPVAATFDLELVNKPAGEVLGQLAAAAGKTIRWDVGTELKRDRLITLSRKTATLQALAQDVATQAGLKIDCEEEQWGVGRIED